MKLNEQNTINLVGQDSPASDYTNYPLPPTRILAHSHKSKDEIEEPDVTREILLRVLGDSKISAFLLFSEQAERVTRHTVILNEPLNDVAALEKRLRSALPYHPRYKSVRIVADKPREGMALFEMANYQDTTVPLRELITSDAFKGVKGRRALAVGKDLGGRHVFTSIEYFPNTLIVGEKYSGKSTMLNTMLLSLLYKHRPDRFRLLIIGEADSPIVGHYADLPHLLAPIITDSRTALAALEWVSDEIDRRLLSFRMGGLHGIDDYNNEVANEMIAKEIMPRILVTVDELSGIAAENKEKAHCLITRLLKYSHATGIYLLLTTRSASRELLPEEVLSRIPTRIALRTLDTAVSKMIIGNNDATKLIGWGDMIYTTLNNAAPLRVQGAYATDKETSRVIGYIKHHCTGVKYDDGLTEALEAAESTAQTDSLEDFAPPAEDYHLAFSSELDDYCRSSIFRVAVDFAVCHSEVSVAMLRDRLDTSIFEAKQLIRLMENLAIVEPTERGGVYKLLITRETWDAVSAKYK